MKVSAHWSTSLRVTVIVVDGQQYRGDHRDAGSEPRDILPCGSQPKLDLDQDAQPEWRTAARPIEGLSRLEPVKTEFSCVDLVL